jgi:hypothetical protein
VSLSSTAYTYNGKTQTPSVKVVNAEGTTLKNGTHYTVTYSSGRKNIGTYKVTVKMKGIYTGSQTLTYKINPISISKCKVSISATSYTYDGSSPMRENSMRSKFNAFFGGFNLIDPETGDFNYITVYFLNGKVVWGEKADVSNTKSNNLKKAILLYVAQPTEPQLNEKTKSFEVYYPAYLLIGGREHLVNLNPNNAIDGISADIIAQDNTEYRQYTVDDVVDGLTVKRVMYPNILVNYTVDSDGYYTLSRVSNTVEIEGEIVEKVIAAGDYTLSIDKETELGSIKDALGNVVVDRVIVEDTTVLYYPDTKEATGSHVYMEYYLGHELPKGIEEVGITSEIYLTPDKETGFWVLDTAIIAAKLEEEVEETVTADPTEDARVHLFATLPTEAVYEDGKVSASYYFKDLYNYEDVTSVNKSLEYNAAKKAEFGKIYAWNKETKDFVEAIDAWKSFESREEITSLIPSMSLIFTDDLFEDGVKLDANTKILAIKNSDPENFEMSEITLDELESLLDTIKAYNEAKGESEKLTATIGTYEEEEVVKIAYILVDWVEYDSTEDVYTVAGVER